MMLHRFLQRRRRALARLPRPTHHSITHTSDPKPHTPTPSHPKPTTTSPSPAPTPTTHQTLATPETLNTYWHIGKSFARLVLGAPVGRPRTAATRPAVVQ